MDKNQLLNSKNIAVGSFAILFLIFLSLIIDNTPLFLLILFLLGGLAIYLVDKKNKKNTETIQKPTFEEELKNTYFPTTSKLKLADVAGLDGAKEELFEIKDFLNNPDKYKKFNARIPKGILFIGPPGVGKTMMAKALAGEAGVPFFYQSGSSFVEIYVGMGAKKVHELFEAAKKSAPSIVFIDEIDSVGKARGGIRSDERDATLNQLLTEMDGFESNSGVVVIAATNKIEMLDDALLRAGRFDRHIHLDLPSVNERKSILEIYLKNRPNSVDIEKLSLITAGFSGASLENFINEASLNAIKLNKQELDMQDFISVKDKVVFGKKQEIALSVEEKEKIALYQSSKAIVAKKLGVEFEKITLFLNNFLSTNNGLESEKHSLYKIAAQISGIVAYDFFYSQRYSNTKEDILIINELIKNHIENFNMEKNLSLQDAIEQAKDIALKTIKTSEQEIKELQKKLITQEIVFFNDI
ncbi:MAG: cell division protease FtsH [Campylobacterota bacterium]|nr:cell division protease FtsH [Campylobacterota bacterium]